MKPVPAFPAWRRAFLALACAAAIPAAASTPPTQLAELADLSLEQLSRVTVTTVARREQRVLDAPASIYVITQEDIRRSGVTSLAEALRLAPNLQVMRRDTSQYVISARGGLTPTANKMLVLVDGRTIYTPLFSGVFYDALALVIEDIERIEVISGPGSTLWGTNAVNGVINVITRSAQETVGSLVAAGAGNRERGASLRHGWATGSNSAVRVYGRYFDRDDQDLASGGSARDDSRRLQLGFRADRQHEASSTTWQGEYHRAEVNNLAGLREISGTSLLGRWRGQMKEGASASLQVYFDHTERMHAGSFDETRDTLDVEGQQTIRPWQNHVVSLGAGYRFSRDRTAPTPTLGFIPPRRTLQLGSLYAQDEITLAPATRLIGGVRLEHNTYTGWEVMPNLRLARSLGEDQMVWAAASRAVRTPSRIDRDLVLPGTPPFAIVSNETFESEIANVAEIGYRRSITRSGSLSLTAFYHDFQRLRTLEPVGAGQSQLANGADGTLYGIEAWGDIRVGPDWRLVWGFVEMRDKVRLRAGRVNTTEDPLGNNPRRSISLRSLWNINEALQLDFFARYVSRLENPAIDSYTQLSARLGWRVSRNLELSLTGENLLDEHAEFGPPSARAVFARGYFAKATWAF